MLAAMERRFLHVAAKYSVAFVNERLPFAPFLGDLKRECDGVGLSTFFPRGRVPDQERLVTRTIW